MAKVLLVEDDNNLREIYEARLQAEGYDIVSASDGEQALVVAKDAKPDLVISDVMMPKISGFEMLDILRNTDGMQDVKVIMLTALGQGEDKDRADQLGADKYLVKSQVTLEDIVGTAHQLLDDAPAPASAEPAATSDDAASTAGTTTEPATATAPTPPPADPVIAAPAPEPAAATDTPAPVAAPEPVATTPAAEPTAAPAAPAASNPASDEAASEADEEAAMQQQINDFANQPAAATKEVTPTPAAPTEEATVPSAAEPTAPTESTAAASTEQQHDAILNEAVDSLNAATDRNVVPSKPSDVTAVEVPAEPAAAPSAPVTPPPAEPGATPDPAPAVTPAPTTQPEPAQPPAAPTSDGVAIAGKKVIQPLSGTTTDATGASSKPDLNELLAREEAKAPTPTEPGAPAEQQPTPAAPTAPATPAANDTVDPNSIAL